MRLDISRNSLFLGTILTKTLTMSNKEILNAINSGLEVISTCNSIKLIKLDNELYFGFIGTNSAMKVQSEKELNLYNWTLSRFSEHLAR